MLNPIKCLTFAVVLSLGFTAMQAQADLLQDFDSLGGNDVLLEKAQAISGQTKIAVVQPRIVDRDLRFELAPEYSQVLGGDAYLLSQAVGANLYFHITPRWSLGVKHNTYSNRMRAEGENLINDSSLFGKTYVPAMDYPKDQTLGLLSWYPIYGKMNFLDLGTVQFDVYAVVGSGRIELSSGSKETLLAGGGVGFWWSQHLSTRAEITYQTYEAKNYQGVQNMGITQASVQLGVLF